MYRKKALDYYFVQTAAGSLKNSLTEKVASGLDLNFLDIPVRSLRLRLNLKLTLQFGRSLTHLNFK